MPSKVALLRGDSLELLNNPDGFRATAFDGTVLAGPIKRVHACVSDPPYGFDFAGDKDWDTFEDNRSCTTMADQSAAFAKFTRDWSYRLRTDILFPGSHCLAFSADKTIDLVGRGLREAGYEIVRLFFWMYSTSFLKAPTDVLTGSEPIFVARVPTDQQLKKLFTDKGIGQLHAQTLKAEDGRHPNNMMVSEEAVQLDQDLIDLVNKSKASFFVPKPSAKDRDWGCENLPLTKKETSFGFKSAQGVEARNFHPTVKPIEVMRRLIKVVSRPGHTIIDPFLGSGTTGVAAVLEGRNFIGIEREPDYFRVCSHRIAAALREMGDNEQADALIAAVS
jgi:hypothetical protein